MHFHWFVQYWSGWCEFLQLGVRMLCFRHASSCDLSDDRCFGLKHSLGIRHVPIQGGLDAIRDPIQDTMGCSIPIPNNTPTIPNDGARGFPTMNPRTKDRSRTG